MPRLRACIHCSASKVRCDGGRPCDRCIRLALNCERATPIKRCGPCLAAKVRCARKRPCGRCIQHGLECTPIPTSNLPTLKQLSTVPKLFEPPKPPIQQKLSKTVPKVRSVSNISSTSKVSGASSASGKLKVSKVPKVPKVSIIPLKPTQLSTRDVGVQTEDHLLYKGITIFDITKYGTPVHGTGGLTLVPKASTSQTHATEYGVAERGAPVIGDLTTQNLLRQSDSEYCEPVNDMNRQDVEGYKALFCDEEPFSFPEFIFSGDDDIATLEELFTDS